MGAGRPDEASLCKLFQKSRMSEKSPLTLKYEKNFVLVFLGWDSMVCGFCDSCRRFANSARALTSLSTSMTGFIFTHIRKSTRRMYTLLNPATAQKANKIYNNFFNLQMLKVHIDNISILAHTFQSCWGTLWRYGGTKVGSIFVHSLWSLSLLLL